MAGKFRGDVGKPVKPKRSKSSRRSKGKKVVALVKRSPKLQENALQSRLSELVGGAGGSCDAAMSRVGIATAVASHDQPQQKVIGKATIDIVGKRTERVVPRQDADRQRSTSEAIGLKILHQAVKDQNYNKVLPHQNRHDYEYKLRSIANIGVVQLFNSLAQARKAAADVEAVSDNLTSDKASEKKQVISREAFLAALRQPQQVSQF